MQQSGIRAAPLHSHVERFQRQVAIVDGAQRPPDDETRIEIKDGGEIELRAAADHKLGGVAEPTRRKEAIDRWVEQSREKIATLSRLITRPEKSTVLSRLASGLTSRGQRKHGLDGATSRTASGVHLLDRVLGRRINIGEHLALYDFVVAGQRDFNAIRPEHPRATSNPTLLPDHSLGHGMDSLTTRGRLRPKTFVKLRNTMPEGAPTQISVTVEIIEAEYWC
jgi:hypothetical protein